MITTAAVKTLKLNNGLSEGEIFQSIQVYSLTGFPLLNKTNTAISDISEKLSSLDGGLYIITCLSRSNALFTYRLQVQESENLIKIS